MRVMVCFLIALLAATPQVAPSGVQDAPAPTHVAFVGARIIDGTGTAPIADGVMVVQNGKIAPSGRRRASRFPPAPRAWPSRARRSCPGIINAHGHVADVRGLTASPEFYTPEYVRDQLGVYARYGVTTVFSLGGDGPAGVQVRDENPAGMARLFVAGPVISSPTPEAARRPWTRQGDEGRPREDSRRRQPGSGEEDAGRGLARRHRTGAQAQAGRRRAHLLPRRTPRTSSRPAAT